MHIPSIDTSISYYSDSFEKKQPNKKNIEDPDYDPVPGPTFKRIEISKKPYLPDQNLAKVVDVAIALGRPLLLQGEPGSGKTGLAYSVAYTLGFPLQVSYLKSTSRAQDLLYTYDALNRLYNAQLKPDQQPKKDDQPIGLNIENYIRLGSLGKAIARAEYGRRSVVLIDEIDKADFDFPNDLLWELDQFKFEVTEDPSICYSVPDEKLRPIIIITHNEEKPLPTAFLRRCIFHHVEFPQDKKRLLEILNAYNIKDKKLSEKAIEILLRLRQLELRKRPGLSELLDWVRYSKAVKTPVKNLEKLPNIGVLLKEKSDIQLANEEFNDQ